MFDWTLKDFAYVGGVENGCALYWKSTPRKVTGFDPVWRYFEDGTDRRWACVATPGSIMVVVSAPLGLNLHNVKAILETLEQCYEGQKDTFPYPDYWRKCRDFRFDYISGTKLVRLEKSIL